MGPKQSSLEDVGVKIIVSGATGYIGSVICKAAASEGHEVIALINNSPIDCFNEKNINCYKTDILLDIFNLPEFNNVDLIIHTATANDKISKDFNQGVDLSFYGTKNILDFAIRNSIENIIYFSTAQVYGTNLEGNISEDSKLSLESPYALNHNLGEVLCDFYQKKYHLNIIIARPSNGFGVPFLNINRRSYLVPLCFAKSILIKNEIVLGSSGKQLRNFVFLKTIASTCLKLLKKFPKGLNYINMGSHLYLSIFEVAQIASRIALDEHNIRTNLIVESTEPNSSNYFTYTSKFMGYSDSLETTADQFNSVISELLKKGPHFYG